MTPERGLVPAIAKGARAPKGSFQGGIPLGVLGEADLLPRRGAELELLRSFRVTDGLRGLRDDVGRFAAGEYVLGLLRDLARPALGNEPLFLAGVTALKALSTAPPEAAPTWVLLFEARALAATGHRPHLATCVGCGGELGRDTVFAAALGGTAHRRCVTAGPSAPLSPRGARDAASLLHRAARRARRRAAVALGPARGPRGARPVPALRPRARARRPTDAAALTPPGRPTRTPARPGRPRRRPREGGADRADAATNRIVAAAVAGSVATTHCERTGARAAAPRIRRTSPPRPGTSRGRATTPRRIGSGSRGGVRPGTGALPVRASRGPAASPGGTRKRLRSPTLGASGHASTHAAAGSPPSQRAVVREHRPSVAAQGEGERRLAPASRRGHEQGRLPIGRQEDGAVDEPHAVAPQALGERRDRHALGDGVALGRVGREADVQPSVGGQHGLAAPASDDGRREARGDVARRAPERAPRRRPRTGPRRPSARAARRSPTARRSTPPRPRGPRAGPARGRSRRRAPCTAPGRGRCGGGAALRCPRPWRPRAARSPRALRRGRRARPRRPRAPRRAASTASSRATRGRRDAPARGRSRARRRASRTARPRWPRPRARGSAGARRPCR